MKRDYKLAPYAIEESLQPFAVRKAIDELPEKAAELESAKKGLDPEQKRLLPDFIAPENVSCAFANGGILWVGTSEGLWRINPDEAEPLDRFQAFRALRYLTDNNVKSVAGDGKDGVWVLTEKGVSHIEMKSMSAKRKAELLSEVNYTYMNRRGMLSGGRWSPKQKKWVGRESDNDGLWTSLVAMGDICRYGVLKNDPAADPADVARAKELATLWTEACLLLCCIPGWKGKVPAFVRYNQPGTNRSSSLYLKEGGRPGTNMPEHGPAGLVEAEYSPEHPEDWAETNAMPEVVFKNIEGYIARSYHVNDPENDPAPVGDGVFFRKLYNDEGKLISVRIPSTTTKGDDMPPLYCVDSSLPVPERLRRLYTSEINPKTGKPFGDDDIIYKCDTSNDELVGHYAVWQLAYDILGPDDPELAQIITDVARRHARHMSDNDYSHTDAGGQPTSWARMNREYYMNKGSYGVPDAPLSASILLQLYKVAYHVTGDDEWNREYRKIALDEPYRYADLMGEYYDRYAIGAKRMLGDDLTDEQIWKAVVTEANYSDIRMSAVSFYTLMQLEDDPVLVEKYRAAADSWWKILKYSRDVEWYLTYQLAFNDRECRDGFGRPLGEILRWQLSHFTVNPKSIQIDNSTRPDAEAHENILWYKGTDIPFAVSMSERGGFGSDPYFACGGGRGNSIDKTYNMIMPYWVARYNGLITEKGKDGDVTLKDIDKLINQD